MEMIEHSSCNKQSPFRLAFIVHISPHTLYTINCLFLSFILNYFMNSFSFCKFCVRVCVCVFVCKSRIHSLQIQHNNVEKLLVFFFVCVVVGAIVLHAIYLGFIRFERATFGLLLICMHVSVLAFVRTGKRIRFEQICRSYHRACLIDRISIHTVRPR